MPDLKTNDPILRFDPLKELEEMSSRLSRFFAPQKNGNGNGESLTIAEWAPAVDVTETDKEFLIKVELPGIKKEDVKVTVEDGNLAIRGERKQEKEEKGQKYHRIERSYGSFFRSFALPSEADGKKIAADFKDGVLAIQLPKTEKAKPTATEIKIA